MSKITIRKLFILLFAIVFISIISLYASLQNVYDINYPKLERIPKFEAGRRIFPKTRNFFENNVNFYKIDQKAYAVSAFTDDRNGNMGYRYVRVLVVIKQKIDFECVINGSKSRNVSLYELSENHHMDMQVFILNCPMPDFIQFDDIEYVELRREGSSKPFTNVPVKYRIENEKNMKSEPRIHMSICVPVLFPGAYDAKRIVEFIELNSLQGIDRIFMYYNPKTLDGKMNKTLQYYTDNHILHLINFQLPFSENDVWYHGQLITITDCLLRNSGLSKYTFFNDIDEFFVPMSNMSMMETLNLLFVNTSSGSQRVAANLINLENTNPPITLHNSQGSSNLETRYTKCVVRPEMVFEQGIHHTSRVIQDDYTTDAHNGSLLQVFHFKKRNTCCEKRLELINGYSNALKNQFEYVVKILDL
ncbi:unnamed protein product [Caenorhabditis bovis]|uniref:Glycosyltransferase family 92 protein n=1 Tax=Caenorhabditis bovis TaxID=2654633 RepID=A0A8S1E8Q2_9PELO|nr:unnamed protein product [Caenorhabditis bovis]